MDVRSLNYEGLQTTQAEIESLAHASDGWSNREARQSRYASGASERRGPSQLNPLSNPQFQGTAASVAALRPADAAPEQQH